MCVCDMAQTLKLRKQFNHDNLAMGALRVVNLWIETVRRPVYDAAATLIQKFARRRYYESSVPFISTFLS